MTDRPELPSLPSPETQGGFPAFAIERAFGTSVRTFMANLVPFLAVATLIESPVVVLNVLWRSTAVPGQPPDMTTLYPLAAVLAGLIAHFVVTGTLLFGVYKHLRHQPFTWVECLTQGLRKFPTILLTSIVVGLATALGLVFCVVPGLYVMSVYAVAVPAAVVEGGGALPAMSRSKALTAGYRWPVFGVLMLMGIISSIPSVVATLALANEPIALAVVTSAWQVFSVAFQAVVYCVIYYQLRESREDLSASDLAAVFD